MTSHEGWISRARARDVYRVALDEQGQVADEETRRLRAEIAAAP